jgi:MFS family permease
MALNDPNSKATLRSSAQRPTRKRYWVIGFAVTLAMITYIDRVCISQAAPGIRSDLGLTDAQMGWIFGAFGLAYALCEIPGGLLGDWLGPRRVLMRVVLWWSCFTAATGWTWSFASLWVTRFLFGAGEAGCFPNLTKAFTLWLTKPERTRAQGIMWMSARWGGAVTPLLIVAAFTYMSWRLAFTLFGAIGVIWAVIFYFWFRDNPRDHPDVNAAESELLKGNEVNLAHHTRVPWGRVVASPAFWLLWLITVLASPWRFVWMPSHRILSIIIWSTIILIGALLSHFWFRRYSRGHATVAAAESGGLAGNEANPSGHGHVPWGRLVASPTVWGLWGQYFCISYGWYFYITWLPTYLQEARGVTLGKSAFLAGLPLFLGGLGCLLAGFLLGWTVRHSRSVAFSRRVLGFVGCTAASGLLLWSAYIQDPWLAMVSMGLAGFANDLTLPGAWSTCMDVGGRFAGTLSGSMNMMGNFGGMAGPVVVGLILEHTHRNWEITFWLSSAIYFLGALCWLIIDPVTPLEIAKTLEGPKPVGEPARA